MSDDSMYSDIINIPHWEPSCHIRMSMDERAAQFAPFAALVGYDELIDSIEKNHNEEH